MRILFAILIAAAGLAGAQSSGAPLPDETSVYLNLTEEQKTTIAKLRSVRVLAWEEKSMRFTAVINELMEERSKASPDPLAVGQRIVEIDTIRREIEAMDAKLAAEIRASLTPAQLAKLLQLEDAQKLRRQVETAVCEGYLLPLPSVGQTLLQSISLTITQPCTGITSYGFASQPRQ